MEYRSLGTSSFEVSALSLGTWALGGDPNAWGRVDDNESIATIAQAVDSGVNLIDTSPAYGAGHAEELVGLAIAERRAAVLVATTCGAVPPARPPGAATPQASRASIIRDCEASLRRLRTDYIDLYWCAWPDPATPVVEVMAALKQLREEGKVRAVGLTHAGCEEVAAALEFGPLHALQYPLSLLQRRATHDLLPFCIEHRIATLACGSLAKGLLTGRFTENTRVTGLRATDPEFGGARYRRNLACVRQLAALAARHDRTIAQLALQWVLQQRGVTSVIVGAKRPSQLQENLGALAWRFAPEDLTAIETILAGS